jgi:phospholipid/cholesterol/gamma-HCH transport system substrate-binding protein
VEARKTLQAATEALKRVDALAGSTASLIDTDGKPLIADMRHTIATAEASLKRIDALTDAAKPGLATLNDETLPEANRLLRDLREMTNNLGAVAAKLDEDPARALLGGRPLPDYVPAKSEKAK